jgi:S-adenosylmethionine:tRNA ribosyltransferase-isomerase
MKLSEFDYYLPQELIAQEPVERREASRLLVVEGENFYHRHFNECIGYINKGDILVLNNTRVIPARLYAKKLPSGGKIELLLIEELREGIWKCLAKPSRRVKPGSSLSFAGGLLEGRVTGRENDGTRIITFED